MPRDPVVIMLVGISEGGKSSLARRLARGRPGLAIMSYDAQQHALDGTDPARSGRAPIVTDGAVELVHAQLEARCQARGSSGKPLPCWRGSCHPRVGQGRTDFGAAGDGGDVGVPGQGHQHRGGSTFGGRATRRTVDNLR